MTVELGKPIAMDEGLRFAIREGGRTVGAGRVTKIIKYTRGKPPRTPRKIGAEVDDSDRWRDDEQQRAAQRLQDDRRLRLRSGGPDAEERQARAKITLECTECKHRNYITMKSKINDRERLEMKKYCNNDRKHTLHKETR